MEVSEMNSSPGGPIAILFMMVPLIVVPLIAIFGIPNLPTNFSSAATEESAIQFDDLQEETGVGNSSAHHHSEAPAFDDEVSEFETDTEFTTANEKSEHQSSNHHHDDHGHSHKKRKKNWNPPSEALEGWNVDSSKKEKEPNKFRQKYDDEEDGFQPQSNNSINGMLSRRSQEDVEQLDFSDSFDSNGSTENETEEDEWINDEALTNANPLTLKTAEIDKQPTSGKGSQAEWSMAIKKLQSYGIKNYQMVPGSDPGEFLFRCATVSRGNSRLVYRFEAEATEPLAAVADVLRQVEKWNQGQK
jgi:hypothetical protein